MTTFVSEPEPVAYCTVCGVPLDSAEPRPVAGGQLVACAQCQPAVRLQWRDGCWDFESCEYHCPTRDDCVWRGYAVNHPQRARR